MFRRLWQKLFGGDDRQLGLDRYMLSGLPPPPDPGRPDQLVREDGKWVRRPLTDEEEARMSRTGRPEKGRAVTVRRKAEVVDFKRGA